MQNTTAVFGRILLPFCIGIWVLQGTDYTKLNLPALQITIILIILLLIFNLLYRLLKVYNHKQLIGVLINLLFFTFGIQTYQRADETQNSNNFSRSPAEFLKISISSEPQQQGSMIRFKASVMNVYTVNKKQRSSGTILVTIRSASFHPTVPHYGEVYLIPAAYRAIEPPYNAAEFDFRYWLAMQHIHYQIFLLPEELIPLQQYSGTALIGFALKLRKQQVNQYRRLIKNDDAFAVASTLILGYRADLNAETLAAYSRTGTIHALSVSGMHVGIIYFVLNWLLGWMNSKRFMKWVKVILVLCTIWFYTLLTGYSASVLRSAIMLSVYVLGKAIHQETNSYHILFFSAFCLLFYNPFLLWDVGFQLSYMAVLGLVYLQPKLQQLVSSRYQLVQKLWNLISISIAAQVFTFPLSCYYFHQFPVYFIISNLFITLPVILLMYIGIFLLIFHLYWISPLFECLIILMNRGLEKIAALPYSGISAIWLSRTGLVLLCSFLFFLFFSLTYKKKHFLAISLLSLASLQGIRINDKIIARHQQKIILFSLNRNYAAGFINGEHAILVTDLKTGDKAFKFHIQPALDQSGIRSVICIPWNTTIHQYGLTINEHQLVFGNYRVLLLDSSFNGQRIKLRPLFNAVWIHGNPRIKMDEFRQDVSFNKLWIDATNKSYAIQNYQRDTINFRSSTLVLRKNKGYLIYIKQKI
ncbi:ComEC/Rec2 family competence protein [Pedobacter cryoconitis]|uniref:Competence protein ComEC n=1 Tax=Pedobacter cryoconitis TaxID=188932 RepID=A0A7X0J6Q4_9SPHI|nr:ComEC/Rec2 family competence protein [Pedobacter cryoconitis]MBB6502123.1 competence protein ComEC [Pedobacter cryoconitis]